MIDRLPLLALLVLASLPAAAAAPTTRTFSVTGFDRIRVDGPYKVSLRTNVAPYARATGTLASIDGLNMKVEGVRGLAFEISIQGSGTARVDQVDVDQMKVGVSGAGTTRLSGRAAKLTATVRGTSAFEADGLRVTDAVIGAEGPSVVRAQVTNSAKVDASGLVSVTLTGDPACTVKARGSASVDGCKGTRF